jgi:hypothetical protein
MGSIRKEKKAQNDRAGRARSRPFRSEQNAKGNSKKGMIWLRKQLMRMFIGLI